MLVLSRKEEESIILTILDASKVKNGDSIEIKVLGLSNHQKLAVRIGVNAPEHVNISRTQPE